MQISKNKAKMFCKGLHTVMVCCRVGGLVGVVLRKHGNWSFRFGYYIWTGHLDCSYVVEKVSEIS